jgi:hypothetical protein
VHIDPKFLTEEFTDTCYQILPAQSRDDLIAQSIIAKRMGLLTSLAYRGTQLPPELDESISPDVLFHAKKLAETETPACEMSFSAGVNTWLSKQARSKQARSKSWMYMIPDAVHRMHNLPPSGLSNGWMTAMNDTYIPETDDRNYSHPLDNFRRDFSGGGRGT